MPPFKEGLKIRTFTKLSGQDSWFSGVPGTTQVCSVAKAQDRIQYFDGLMAVLPKAFSAELMVLS